MVESQSNHCKDIKTQRMEKSQDLIRNWLKALWNYGECNQQKLIN